MLHPSYSDLMKVVNSDVDVEHGEHPVVNSRYSIVMATSKRARQLVDSEDPLVPGMEGEKPLSIAVEELNRGKIKILSDEDKLIAEQEYKERKDKEAAEKALKEAEEAAREESGAEEEEPAPVEESTEEGE